MSRLKPRFHRVNPFLPPVGGNQGVVEFIFQGVIENQMTINTFSYLGPNFAPTQPQLTTLANNITANLKATYLLAISADWALTQRKINVVHRNDIAGQVFGDNSGGGGPANHLPTEVSAVILRSTAVKGQHGRGRVSLPAVPISWVTASTITNAFGILAYNNLAVNMLAVASDGTNNWVPCIGQRGTVAPPVIIGAAPITRLFLDALVGTIRRRKIGRGK